MAVGARGNTGEIADRWLWQPVSTRSAQAGRLVIGLGMLFAALGSVLLGCTLQRPFLLPDADQYLRMAQGGKRGVPEPFVWRPLGPWIADALHHMLGCTVQHGFALLSAASLLFTLWTVLWLLLRTEAPRWMIPALLLLPLWPQMWNVLAMPDPLHAGLLSGLLLCLRSERHRWLAAPMIFPLMLARESTSLVLLCLLVAGWRQLGWKPSLLAVVAAAAGSAVVRLWARGAQPNLEHMDGALYLPAKLLWNAVRTSGVVPWSNVYPLLCGTPAWQHRLVLGPVRAVGVCGYSPLPPAEAVVALLSTFGLLPLLALRLWRRRQPAGAGTTLRRFCLLYGGVSFLLAPVLGTWFTRLIAYGWPAFLVGVPMLFPQAVPATRRRGSAPRPGLLLLVQAGLVWAVFFVHSAAGFWAVPGIFLVGAALLFSRWGAPLGAAVAAQAEGARVVESSLGKLI